MLPVFISVLYGVVFILIGNVFETVNTGTTLLKTAKKKSEHVIVAKALNDYYTETLTLPSSLANLASTTNGWHVADKINTWQGFYLVTSISDGAAWTFDRSIFFTMDPTRGVVPSQYIGATNNTCGSGAGNLNTTSYWCGRKDSQWSRIDTKEINALKINDDHYRLQRLAQKLTQMKSASGSLPSLDYASAPITTPKPLATIVNYGGSATTCSGTFVWQGVPVECSDMYDAWSQPIYYSYTSATVGKIYVNTGAVSSTGTSVVVGISLNLT
jgi:hypothetical protein